MDNESKNANTVPVLVWDAGKSTPRVANVPAPNEIPSEVWKALNKVFLKRLAEGWFAPLDPADAYHFAMHKMLDANLRKTDISGEAKAKYLVATARTSLVYYFCRTVLPARKNAQLLSNWTDGMAKKYGLAEEEIDVQSLVEMMPYVPRPSDERNEARRILADLMPRLPMPVQLAFKAYIEANGNLFATAALIKMPWRTFCRKWPKYLFIARKIAVKGAC